MTHEELKKKALQNPAVKAEYDALETEFNLLHDMIEARHRAGLSQSEVARRMGAQPPAVARLESFGKYHSPSIKTLKRYAHAVGCHLEIKLIPDSSS